MKPTAYIETTVISLLAARPSRNPVDAGRQRITKAWWDADSKDFNLVSSEVVEAEASVGDPAIAKIRRDYLSFMPLLRTTPELIALAKAILDAGIIPPKAAADASHIALATLNKIDFIATWNFAHLANGQILRRWRQFLSQKGYNEPDICQPDQLPAGDEA